MGAQHNLEIDIPCGDGTLEGRLLYKDSEVSTPGMIICPPHPLLAGNIDNNVVTAIAQEIAPSMPVLLFNYRGVGRSWSPRPELPVYEYWNEVDRTDDYSEMVADLDGIISWSASFFDSFHLVGYSFGAYIALQAQHQRTSSYIAISPPLFEHDFSRIRTFSRPSMIISADNDNLIKKTDIDLNDFFDRKEYICTTDHFFRRKESEVAALVLDFLSTA